MCGEKRDGRRLKYPGLGSPPRVRGKVYSLTLWVPHGRITPACAGKSWLPLPPSAGGGDHPRVCGEKLLHGQRTDFTVGSPPRVRGKVLALIYLLLPLGITPACAGKRAREPEKAERNEDHPRVCGEKFGVNGHRLR